MCLRAIKTKHCRQRVGLYLSSARSAITLGPSGSTLLVLRQSRVEDLCFKEISSFQNLRRKGGKFDHRAGRPDVLLAQNKPLEVYSVLFFRRQRPNFCPSRAIDSRHEYISGLWKRSAATLHNSAARSFFEARLVVDPTKRWSWRVSMHATYVRWSSVSLSLSLSLSFCVCVCVCMRASSQRMTSSSSNSNLTAYHRRGQTNRPNRYN